jgi:hypothetical protein
MGDMPALDHIADDHRPGVQGHPAGVVNRRDERIPQPGERHAFDEHRRTTSKVRKVHDVVSRVARFLV